MQSKGVVVPSLADEKSPQSGTITECYSTPTLNNTLCLTLCVQSKGVVVPSLADEKSPQSGTITEYYSTPTLNKTLY